MTRVSLPGAAWLATAALAAGVVAVTVASAPAARASASDTLPPTQTRAGVVADSVAHTGIVTLSPSGTIEVTARGNGHGHGLSQYGAQGAALAGKSWRQIVDFYYPGTHLTRLTQRSIRVRVSGFGTTTTVAASSDLTVSGLGALPSAGVTRYRLIAGKRGGVVVQQQRSAAWHDFRTGLPDGATFARSSGAAIRLFAPAGTSTAYLGTLSAVRDGAGGVLTVNRVTLDQYTAGVVPREMPSGWARAATDAQAIAARTYGWYGVLHPRAGAYDICDDTNCQVYGGHARYDRAGDVLYTDFPRAAADTANRVLTYRGQAAFTQFSASNGGWSADGGQPYLLARRDPYDARNSGDPYLGYTRTVGASSLGRWYGIARLDSITVTRRDGNGSWGGRVVAATLTGRGSNGHRMSVRTDGPSLQAALGLGTTLFTVAAAP